MKADAIRREALALSVPEQAELVELLLSRLNVLSEAEITLLWSTE